MALWKRKPNEPRLIENPERYTRRVTELVDSFLASHSKYRFPLIRSFSLNKRVIPNIQKLGEQLKRESDGKLIGIGLVGSHARGYAISHSDVDLVLFWKEWLRTEESSKWENRASEILCQLGSYKVESRSVCLSFPYFHVPVEGSLAFICVPVYNRAGIAEFRKNLLEKAREHGREGYWDWVKEDDEISWRVSAMKAATRLVSRAENELTGQNIVISSDKIAHQKAIGGLILQVHNKLIDKMVGAKKGRLGLRGSIEEEIAHQEMLTEKYKRRKKGRS